jgi:large subunit ribosomal protein L13
MIVDATNQIVGRLGAIVAKKALLGEKIDIINAENAVVSGRRADVLENFRNKVARGTWAKGPHYLRSPDMLLKRLIRDMLPYKQERGINAFKSIMCWKGVPDQFRDKKATSFKEADASKLTISYVTIKEISKFVGGNVG